MTKRRLDNYRRLLLQQFLFDMKRYGRPGKQTLKLAAQIRRAKNGKRV